MDVELGPLCVQKKVVPETKEESFGKKITNYFGTKVNPGFSDIHSFLDYQEHLTPTETFLFMHNTSIETGVFEFKNNSGDEEPEPIEFKGFSPYIWLLFLLSTLFALRFIALKDYFDLTASVGLIVMSFLLLIAAYSHSRFPSYMKNVKRIKKNIDYQVKRDSVWTPVNYKNIVVGDLIKIEKGQFSRVDMRVVECTDLWIKLDSVTGDHEKRKISSLPSTQSPLEAANLIFHGSEIVSGSGLGVCIRTHDDTLVSKIVKFFKQNEKRSTIAKVLSNYTLISSLSAFTLAVVFSAVAVFLERNWDSLNVFAGIILSILPLTILLAVSLGLKIMYWKLKRKGIVVRQHDSVPALGTVSSIVCNVQIFLENQTELYFWYDSGLNDSSPTKDLIHLTLHILSRTQNESRIEKAFKRYFETLDDDSTFQERFPILFHVPLKEETRTKCTVYTNLDSKATLCGYGSPEYILSKCKQVFRNGELFAISDQWLDSAKHALEELRIEGNTVIAIFERDLDSVESIPECDFVFLGFVSISDSVKDCSKNVCKLEGAGIRTFIASEEDSCTVLNVARKSGVVKGKTREELAAEQGIDLSQVDTKTVSIRIVDKHLDFSPHEWIELFRFKHVLFCRMTSEQKLLIVEQAQKFGQVAFCGNDFHDLNSMFRADVSLASPSSSRVAKDASMLILSDYSDIEIGVLKGRLIFENMKKAVLAMTLMIPSLVLPFILYAILNCPPILGVSHVCLLLLQSLLPTLALIFDDPERDLMKRKPKIGKLVNRFNMLYSLQIGIVQALCSLACFFVILHFEGFRMNWVIYNSEKFMHWTLLYGHSTASRLHSLHKAQYGYMLCTTISQYFVCVSCSTRKISLLYHLDRSWRLILFGAVSFAVVVGAGLWKRMDSVFGEFCLWVLWIAIPCGIYIVIYDEFRKYFKRKSIFPRKNK